jgi:hypothetical protein
MITLKEIKKIGALPPLTQEEARALLLHSPLSYDKMADILGVHPQTIRKWLCPNTPGPVHALGSFVIRLLAGAT